MHLATHNTHFGKVKDGPDSAKVCDVPNAGSVDMRPITTVSRLITVKEYKKGNGDLNIACLTMAMTP